MSLRCHTNHIIHHHHHTTVWQQRTQQGRPHAQHVSRRCEARARTRTTLRSSSTTHRSKHSQPRVYHVRTSSRVESSLAESQPPGSRSHRSTPASTSTTTTTTTYRRTDVPYVPYVPVHAQPPSKGSLRGSKCTPLCNSQLPACKPIVCRRSQVSKSYIDAEQRRQRSSISILAVRRRARALSSRSDQ